MLEDRAAGREPDFDGFMERFGDFFPENPRNLDELLELMAQRMAAMQAMLNSMTPEQRAQLQGLSEQLLEDMDLRWQMDQLRQPPAGVPRHGLEPPLRLRGPGPARLRRRRPGHERARRPRPARAADARRIANPVRWPRSTSTGPASCSATKPPTASRRWPSWPRCSRRPGSSRTGRAATSSRPPASATSASNALDDLFSKLARDKLGQHELDPHRPRPRAGRTTPSPTSSATRSTSTSSAPSATPWPAAAAARPVRLSPDDFEIEQTEHAHPVEHRADGRPVAVDADARQLPRRQEGGDGAALADLEPVPARLPRPRRLQRGRPRHRAARAARGLLGLRLRHEHAARLPAGPQDARPRVRHQADHHDHRRRAHRPHHRSRARRSSTTRRCRRRSTPRSPR